MAKLIQKAFGKLVTVEPSRLHTNDETWLWRKNYEGFYGIMHFYQCQHKLAKKHFIVIYDIEMHYLKTGSGELKIDGKLITLITKNSKYTFERFDIKEKAGD